jgi:hypothetical protein
MCWWLVGGLKLVGKGGFAVYMVEAAKRTMMGGEGG